MDNFKIDFSYINILADNDRVFKEEYLRTFQKTCDDALPQMKVAFHSKDFTLLGKLAHKLKPSAKMIGLPCSENLEHLQHHPESIEDGDIERFEAELSLAAQQLAGWVNTRIC